MPLECRSQILCVSCVAALEASKAGFAAKVLPTRASLIAEETYDIVRSCETLFGDKAALDARLRLREVRAEAGGRVSDEMVAALQSLDRPRRTGVPWSLHEDILLLGQIIACVESKEIDKIKTTCPARAGGVASGTVDRYRSRYRHRHRYRSR